MPPRRRLVKVYKTRVHEDGFGKLGENSVTHTKLNFPENDLAAAMRFPIVPQIKSLAGNTAPCESVTTNRNIFVSHKNVIPPEPIIKEAQIKRDPKATFYSETTASKHFEPKKLDQKLEAARPGSGTQTKTLLETGIPVKNPFDLQKPCVDLNPKMDDGCGVVRVVRPSGVSDEKMNEIRAKLKQKNIGPGCAGNLLKPGSRMNFRTTSMVDFHSKNTQRLKIVTKNKIETFDAICFPTFFHSICTTNYSCRE